MAWRVRSTGCAGAERAVSAGLPEKDAALVLGMVLGEDEQHRHRPRATTSATPVLAHLLAVSGQNVMLLAALALPCSRPPGLPGPRGRGLAP